MSYKVIVGLPSEADIKEASLWYKQQAKGLGVEFLVAVEHRIQIIQGNPYIFQARYKKVYQTSLLRFPFSIYFKVEENVIFILAVLHNSRNPKIWQKR